MEEINYTLQHSSSEASGILGQNKVSGESN